MNLSQNPETICIHLGLTGGNAFFLVGELANGIEGRHFVEKTIQDEFYKCRLDAYLAEGRGNLDDAILIVLTDHPVPVLQALLNLFGKFPIYNSRFPEERPEADLRQFIHLAWRDRQDELWRTFHPLTTRPFWTFLQPDVDIKELMRRGAKVRLKQLLES